MPGAHGVTRLTSYITFCYFTGTQPLPGINSRLPELLLHAVNELAAKINAITSRNKFFIVPIYSQLSDRQACCKLVCAWLRSLKISKDNCFSMEGNLPDLFSIARSSSFANTTRKAHSAWCSIVTAEIKLAK